MLLSDPSSLNLTRNVKLFTFCDETDECQSVNSEFYNFVYNEVERIHDNHYEALDDYDNSPTEIENEINENSNDAFVDGVYKETADQNNCEISPDISYRETKTENYYTNVYNEENNVKTGFTKVVLSLEEQKAELESKRREDKYLEAEFKCYNCALGFLFKDTYQAHMMRHEESNGEHQCPTCSLRFASGAVVRAHMAAHRERHTCLRCGRVLTPQRVAAHRRSCGAASAACPAAACHLCGNTYKSSCALQQHVRRVHGGRGAGAAGGSGGAGGSGAAGGSRRSYCCGVCGKAYHNHAAVRTHMIKHINKKFTCEQCPSTFSSPYTLAQHRKRHSAGWGGAGGALGPHRCEACGTQYDTRKSLLAHRRNAAAHQQTTHACGACGRLCPTRRALQLHSRVHSAPCAPCVPGVPGVPGGPGVPCGPGVPGGPSKRAPPPRAVCHLCGHCFKGNNKLNRHLRQVCEKAKLEEELSALYQE